jgi:hypothetical protein
VAVVACPAPPALDDRSRHVPGDRPMSPVARPRSDDNPITCAHSDPYGRSAGGCDPR